MSNLNSMGEDNFVPKPNNYLPLAIFTTICCCLPVGIYAIILSSKVNTLYAIGNYKAAALKAQEAKNYSLIGIVIGIVIGLIYSIFQIVINSNSLL